MTERQNLLYDKFFSLCQLKLDMVFCLGLFTLFIIIIFIIIIIILLLCEFFTPTLADGFSLEF